mmetsp:Transcript_19171/g.72416  ORF Transcript_19171/g.72416 Transcript_19171/m.72416 type:complete len:251 (-) Transcript_19171:65-817(-)
MVPITAGRELAGRIPPQRLGGVPESRHASKAALPADHRGGAGLHRHGDDPGFRRQRDHRAKSEFFRFLQARLGPQPQRRRQISAAGPSRCLAQGGIPQASLQTRAADRRLPLRVGGRRGVGDGQHAPQEGEPARDSFVFAAEVAAKPSHPRRLGGFRHRFTREGVLRGHVSRVHRAGGRECPSVSATRRRQRAWRIHGSRKIEMAARLHNDERRRSKFPPKASESGLLICTLPGMWYMTLVRQSCFAASQ